MTIYRGSCSTAGPHNHCPVGTCNACMQSKQPLGSWGTLWQTLVTGNLKSYTGQTYWDSAGGGDRHEGLSCCPARCPRSPAWCEIGGERWPSMDLNYPAASRGMGNSCPRLGPWAVRCDPSKVGQATSVPPGRMWLARPRRLSRSANLPASLSLQAASPGPPVAQASSFDDPRLPHPLAHAHADTLTSPTKNSRACPKLH